VTSLWPVLRGQVVRAEIGLSEPKLFVIVSNNRRNRQLPQVLGARLTTSPKPALRSIVELTSSGALVGRVVCDDIVEIYPDEVIELAGALSPRDMAGVDRGLAAALDLPPAQ